VTHTAQEWGDIVRKMYPGYTGHRPRVQLFHGDADTTIRYANHTEAIKEWTNLLGLSTDPSSSQTGITLGTHQAKRQQWKNSCGYVVLDAFTSVGGDHGPSDCLFVSQYVIPFLGLDKTGAVDPEIEQCGSGGGDGGVGGAGGAGGSTGTSNRDGGAGGSAGAGGAPGSGGRPGNDASAGSGGDTGSGGSGKGGAQGSGGVQGSGGSANGGSVNGGAPGSGGAASSGGNASGGSAGSGAGGKSTAGGASGGSSTGGDANSSGCNCAVGKGEVRGHGVWSLPLVLGLAALLRVRRTRPRKP
jgi:hypothetical protein